jgi:carbon-monoxide dehydrogenase large subunit
VTAIGARLPRHEDPRLLRGRGRFGDDISVPGQLWARIVRSPSAHGRVRELDVTAAAKAPGITAVVTANDLPAGLVIPVRLAVGSEDLSAYLQPVLAADVVRYVGEPLAVVVGGDPYACEDAAELVDADIEELPAVLDAGAVRDDGENVAAELTLGYGDTDAAFGQARHVVSIELAIGRHTGVPLEPRCLLAVPEPGEPGDPGDPDRGGIDIYGMTKVPVFNRDLLAGMLGLDETLIHVHAVDAGGGFGIRGEFYPEDFLIPWLAVRLGRPVKWAEDRAEHLMAANHSRQQHHRIAAAFDDEGRITGLRDDIVHDNGAYCRTHGVAVPELTVAMLPGPYRIPAYRGRVRVVLTNKTPCGTYRAPGRFEGTSAREHLLDVAATQLGLDPVALRERDLGPQETADVTVTVTASGEVHVFSGGTSLGQGIQTVLAQIAADALGVDPGTVRVIAGDTAAQPFGAGSWASRSTVVGGSAVHQAATAVRERAVQLVARMTYPYGVHAAVVDVDTQTGQVRVLRYLVAYEVGRAINPMLVEASSGAAWPRGSAARFARSSATTGMASCRRSRSSSNGCRPRRRSRRSTSCWRGTPPLRVIRSA